MTPRSIRRAAEHKARKLAYKAQKLQAAQQTDQPVSPEPRSRGEKDEPAVLSAAKIQARNRANSQLSTGPKTAAGKARSGQNAFKHGLYSEHMIQPGEDPAELDNLRADLRHEHQPVNQTEEILVNELAEQFWRLRRMRRIETRMLDPQNFSHMISDGALALVNRLMASAERGFHKSLAALRQLQKERGFVPQNFAEADDDAGFIRQNLEEPSDNSGFVPSFPIPQPVTAVETGSIPSDDEPLRASYDSFSDPFSAEAA